MKRLLDRLRRADLQVPEFVKTKSAKPHFRVMPAQCGNPDCPCQQMEVSR